MGIIARQSIKASIAGFVGVGLGAFSRLFLYTKYLTPSEIGILETLTKLGLILSPFFFIGAAQVILRYYNRISKDDGRDSGLIYTYLVLLGLVLIPLSSFIFLINKDFIFSLYKKSPELSQYYWIPLIIAVCYGGFQFLKSISTVHMRITVPAILSGVLDRGFILVLLVLYGHFQLVSITHFFYLNIFLFFVVPFLSMIGYIVFVIKPKVEFVNREGVKSILKTTSKYNSYLVLGSLSGVIIAAIDVNMISSQLGTSLAGIYTIAFFMGTVIEIPRRSLTNIIYPVLNKAIIEKDKSAVDNLYKKSSVSQFLVGGFLFIVIWINIDSIFAIIPNGESFASGKLVVLFIGLSKLFDMMMGVNRQIIELSKYYKLNLLINIALSVFVIALNLFFINLDSPTFGGINGVAFASLLAIIIVNLFSLLVVWKKEQLLPFSLNMLKCLIPISMAFLFSNFINIQHHFLSIIVNSLMCVFVFILSTYYFRISEDFILILQSFLKKFK